MKRICITGLGFNTTEDHLREYFARFGNLLECNLRLDVSTGLSRGFGFITFADVDGYIKCTAFTAHRIGDRSIQVTTVGESSNAQQIATKKLIVSFLGIHHVNEISIRQAFSQFGTIQSIEFGRNRQGENLYYCIISFTEQNAVDFAMQRRHCVNGRPVFVRRAVWKEEVKRAEQRERERVAREERGKAHGYAGYGRSNSLPQERMFAAAPSLMGAPSTSSSVPLKYAPQPSAPMYASRTDVYQRAVHQAGYQQAYQYQPDSINTMQEDVYGPQRQRPQPTKPNYNIIPGYGYQ